MRILSIDLSDLIYRTEARYANMYKIAEELHEALGAESNGEKTWRILLSLSEAMLLEFFDYGLNVKLAKNEREKHT